MNSTTHQVERREMFARLTPEKRRLAELLLLKRRVGGAKDSREIQAAPERKHYPATLAQKNFYVLHHRSASKTSCNMTLAFSLEAEIDGDRLEDALNVLVERHEALRTRFEVKAGEVCQVVDPFALVELETQEVPEVDAAAFQAFVRPFHLDRSPLLRCKLFVQTKAARNVMMVDLHHIIADDWAVRVFVTDLAAVLKGDNPKPPPARLRDFAVWENEHYLPSQRFVTEVGYWRGQLQDWSGVIDFSNATQAAEATPSADGIVTIIWQGSEAKCIREFCLANRTTRFSFMVCALTLALHKWTGARDITIGTLTTLRDLGDFGRTIGCFVNDVLIRNQVRPGDGLPDIWRAVQRSVNEAMAHKTCPFVRVVEEIRAAGRATHNVIYTQSTEREAGSEDESGITPWSGAFGSMPTSFDLFVDSSESAHEISVKFFHRQESISLSRLWAFKTLFEEAAGLLLATNRGDC